MEHFKRIILILPLFYFLHSCEQKKCEGFNIKKLPLKNIRFDKIISYSNGIDTLELIQDYFYQSKEINSFSRNIDLCNPSFEVAYQDKDNLLNINYDFSYTPSINKNVNLYLLILKSHIEINLNNIDNNKKQIFIQNRKNTFSLDASKTELIKKIQLEKLKVIMFEKFNGERWFLIKNRFANPAERE